MRWLEGDFDFIFVFSGHECTQISFESNKAIKCDDFVIQPKCASAKQTIMHFRGPSNINFGIFVCFGIFGIKLLYNYLPLLTIYSEYSWYIQSVSVRKFQLALSPTSFPSPPPDRRLGYTRNTHNSPFYCCKAKNITADITSTVNKLSTE